MKTLNLEAMGLQEMTKTEMINNIGGKLEKLIELETIEINGNKEVSSGGGGLNSPGSGALGMLAASQSLNISIGTNFSLIGDYSGGITSSSINSTTQTTNSKTDTLQNAYNKYKANSVFDQLCINDSAWKNGICEQNVSQIGGSVFGLGQYENGYHYRGGDSLFYYDTFIGIKSKQKLED